MWSVKLTTPDRTRVWKRVDRYLRRHQWNNPDQALEEALPLLDHYPWPVHVKRRVIRMLCIAGPREAYRCIQLAWIGRRYAWDKHAPVLQEYAAIEDDDWLTRERLHRYFED